MAKVEISKEVALCFDDVALQDQYSEITSRREVNVMVGDYLPIMSSPMMAIHSLKMAIEFRKYGGIYTHHRYCSVAERLEFANNLLYDEYISRENSGCNVKPPPLAVALGLDESLDDIEELIDMGYTWLVFDFAHANNKMVFEHLKEVKDFLYDRDDYEDISIVVGNISNITDFENMADHYNVMDFIDYIKPSIGSGSACSTRVHTGVGKPLFQSIVDTYESGMFSCVADGGIRSVGDIMKSIGAGADLVMLGSMLCGFDESPAEYSTSEDGVTYHRYFGMASQEAKEISGKDVRNIEGEGTYILNKGKLGDFMRRTIESMQSSLSLQGYEEISYFIGEGRFVRVTPSARVENSVHIKNIGRELK